LIELEETAEKLMTLDPTNMSFLWRDPGREEELIAFALMRPFEMIMLKELSNGAAQRHFTKEDQFDRHSVLIVRTQRSANADWDCGLAGGEVECRRTEACLESKRRTCCRDHAERNESEASYRRCHRRPGELLHHPFLGRMLGDSSQGDAARLQVKEEQLWSANILYTMKSWPPKARRRYTEGLTPPFNR
jgi:hypothetical protein